MNTIRNFLKLEAASGIFLFAVAVLAMLLANTPLQTLYDGFLSTEGEIRLGSFSLTKPLLLWINDGLMAIFFLLIGLEVKREIVDGHLRDASEAILPGIGAFGGMLAPALIYVALNAGDAVALDGWAIPAVTDIAFALGVLSLVGSSVPLSLRIFLLTLAILDDLAAIALIAIFYSGDLSLPAIFLAAVVLVAMAAMNRIGVASITPYALAGMLLWVLVLKSGVHATLAGVATGFMIPFRDRHNPDVFPLKALEHRLHPWVAYFVMPAFAFANAGLTIEDFSLGVMLGAVPIGIIVGLVAGKPAGIFGFCWLAVKAGITSLPSDINFRHLFGVSMLCGIGFTMSLFISSLAFEHGATQYFLLSRLGILVASAIAALLGYITLRRASRAGQALVSGSTTSLSKT